MLQALVGSGAVLPVYQGYTDSRIAGKYSNDDCEPENGQTEDASSNISRQDGERYGRFDVLCGSVQARALWDLRPSRGLLLRDRRLQHHSL